MSDITVPVLIVGGGGCGLTTSILLSEHGIEHHLVERHADTSPLPKAHYLNQRTMEVFRQVGVADSIYKVGTPPKNMGKTRWVTSLGGDGDLDGRTLFTLESFGGGGLENKYAEDSPCLSSNYPQVRLEPLLREHAENRAPTSIHFNRELVSFEQDDTGVHAVILDRETQETYTVHAQYVVAADGGKTVGPALGVQMEGPSGILDMVSTHFTADLSQWWEDDVLITWLLNPKVPARGTAEPWPPWDRPGASTRKSSSCTSRSAPTIPHGSTRTRSFPDCASFSNCPTSNSKYTRSVTGFSKAYSPTNTRSGASSSPATPRIVTPRPPASDSIPPFRTPTTSCGSSPP